MKRKILLVVLTCLLGILVLGSVEAMAITAKKPIILVHGIGGSKFWEDVWWGDDLIWYDLDQTMFSSSDDFLDVMKLNAYGNVTNWNVKTLRDYGYSDYIGEGLVEGIIDKITIPFASVIIFSELIEHLQNNGYQLGVNLFAFPYDWRRDINEIYYQLDEVVELAKQRSGWSKVDIVAHSMGGLVTKRYLLASSTYRSKVDTFISVGTPYFGSPLASWGLTVGDNFAVQVLGINLGVSQAKTRELVTNFPSSYQLFPSQKYFERVINYSNGSYYTWDGIRYNSYFVENGYDFDSDYTYYSHLSYSQVGTAIANRYNPNLYARNASLHNIIDGVSLSSLGVKHYTVANMNVPTMYVMRTTGSSSFESFKFGNGDGTVPYFSAQDWGTTVTGRWYVNDTEHGYLPSCPAVRNLIVQLLTPATTASTTSTASISSTQSSDKAVVENYSLNKVPSGLNGLLVLVKTDEMPLVMKKNNPSAKIGKMKNKDTKIGDKTPEYLIINDIKKGSYIQQFGDVFVVYLPEKEDYIIDLNGKTSAGIQIREFTDSKETTLVTKEGIELKKLETGLEFNMKDKEVKAHK